VDKDFLQFLFCPECRKALELEVFQEKNGRVQEGLLYCSCGALFPITGSIPRIVKDNLKLYKEFWQKYKGKIKKPALSFKEEEVSRETKLKKRTQSSFGYQWRTFYEMSCDFKENFLNYIYPIEPEFFKGKIGLDAGCGFGRHIYNAAKFGAKMVGIDYSRAIESSYQNTATLKDVHLIQGDIYQPPFAKESFDFVYSIGVLHHLPQPEMGFRSLVEYVKPKGSIFIWVYSDQRKFTLRLVEMTRKVTTRLPLGILKVICYIAAFLDYYFFIRPLAFLKKSKLLKKTGLEKLIFPRIWLYSKYPFQVNFADWFDRLSAPIRFYYNEKEISEWFTQAGLKNIKVSSTDYYGIRAYGEKA